MSIHRYWIAYDISEDRERTRVERCLLRYGQRLQKSVFCCVLDGQRLDRLKGELEALGCRSGHIILAATVADPSLSACIGHEQVRMQEEWAFVYTGESE